MYSWRHSSVQHAQVGLPSSQSRSEITNALSTSSSQLFCTVQIFGTDIALALKEKDECVGSDDMTQLRRVFACVAVCWQRRHDTAATCLCLCCSVLAATGKAGGDGGEEDEEHTQRKLADETDTKCVLEGLDERAAEVGRAAHRLLLDHARKEKESKMKLKAEGVVDPEAQDAQEDDGLVRTSGPAEARLPRSVRHLRQLVFLIYLLRRGPLFGISSLQHADEQHTLRDIFLRCGLGTSMRLLSPTLLSFEPTGGLTELPLSTLALQKKGASDFVNQRQLQYLALSDCLLMTEAGLSALAEMRQLQHLDLSGCLQLTDPGLRHLAGLHQLRHLNLSHSQELTGEGLIYLAKLPKLQHLDLSYGLRLTNAGPAHLANLHQLQYLDLHDFRQLTNAGLAHLANLHQLQHLDLGSCGGLTGEGLRHLGGLHRLQHLDLSSGMLLMDADLTHLQHLHKLQHLNLSNCQYLSGTGLVYLTGLKELQRLHLRSCQRLQDVGLMYLAGLENLQHLDVCGCPELTDWGIKDLARLPKLRYLDLSHCRMVSRAGVADAGLERLPQLQELLLPAEEDDDDLYLLSPDRMCCNCDNPWPDGRPGGGRAGRQRLLNVKLTTDTHPHEESERILYLDHHTHVLIWSGKLVAGADYEAIRAACRQRAMQTTQNRLPAAEVSEFVEGSSAARWLLCRLQPSHIDIQNALAAVDKHKAVLLAKLPTPSPQQQLDALLTTFPGLQAMDPAARDALLSKLPPTDELTFRQYWARLAADQFGEDE
eukprot:g81702.t1